MSVESSSVNRGKGGQSRSQQPQSQSNVNSNRNPGLKQQQRGHLLRQLGKLQEELDEKFMPKATPLDSTQNGEEKIDPQKEGKVPVW